MLKISKYYKPFIGSIMLAIVLLFTQAMCDLKLPDYMSDIVNTGIQANGIEHATPQAISENGYILMTKMMAEEDRQLVEANYQKLNVGDSQYIAEYPFLVEQSMYILKEDVKPEDLEKMDKIFGIASRTMLNVITEIIDQSANISNQENASEENMDLAKLYEILPLLDRIPEETIATARDQAKQTPENMLESIGVVFTKAFYEEIQIDVSQLRSDFIWKTGAKMMAICVVGICAAISVGFLGARIGSGIGRDLRKDVFEKVQSFSTIEFNKFSSASLITRTTNDITQVQNVVTMMIRMLFYAPIMGVGSLIMMSSKTNQLTWTIVVACLIIVCLIIFLFIVVLPKIKMVQ